MDLFADRHNPGKPLPSPTPSRSLPIDYSMKLLRGSTILIRQHSPARAGSGRRGRRRAPPCVPRLTRTDFSTAYVAHLLGYLNRDALRIVVDFSNGATRPSSMMTAVNIVEDVRERIAAACSKAEMVGAHGQDVIKLGSETLQLAKDVVRKARDDTAGGLSNARDELKRTL